MGKIMIPLGGFNVGVSAKGFASKMESCDPWLKPPRIVIVLPMGGVSAKGFATKTPYCDP